MKSQEEKPAITFIGAGNMASSLIGGLIADQYPVEKITATNRTGNKLGYLSGCFKITTTQNNREGAATADVIVLAVKPMTLKTVVIEIKDILSTQKPLIISIVTGVSSTSIANWAQCHDLKIVRCMPNTPALLRSGTTGLWANSFVSSKEKAIAESILRAVGVTLWLQEERDLNTVTAVSGSGPAYFFLLMECILDCAKEMGLNEEQAQLLTVNTALGAARMALESGKNICALRQQVTSKGGTTEQAIKSMEEGGIRDLMRKAVTAARNKAEEISELLK